MGAGEDFVQLGVQEALVGPGAAGASDDDAYLATLSRVVVLKLRNPADRERGDGTGGTARGVGAARNGGDVVERAGVGQRRARARVHLLDGDAGLGGDAHHLPCAAGFAQRERDHDVRIALGQHPLVAAVAGGPAVAVPVGGVLVAVDAAPLAPSRRRASRRRGRLRR